MQQPFDYGQRDASSQGDADELRARMAMSPTGRQLVSDGSHVESVYLSDPADLIISPGDGLSVLWYDADTDTLKRAAFTRVTGWRYSTYT